MMAKQRLIVVRSLERWESRAQDPDAAESEDVDTSRTGPLDRLAQYAAAPVSSACLLLVATKIHGSRKLMTLARKGGFLVVGEPLARANLPMFIVREAKERGHPVDGSPVTILSAFW